MNVTILFSIKFHQISDVEVGSYLSGGVDSSYVVAEARPNKTFTVAFDCKWVSEIEYAKDLSDYFKIKHYSKVISADEFFDIYLLLSIIWMSLVRMCQLCRYIF